MKLEFWQIFKKKTPSNIKFHQNRPVGAELVNAEGRTYMTKLVVAFRNFAHARTHAEKYVIFIAFPMATMVSWTRPIVALYVHCLSCIVWSHRQSCDVADFDTIQLQHRRSCWTVYKWQMTRSELLKFLDSWYCYRWRAVGEFLSYTSRLPCVLTAYSIKGPTVLAIKRVAPTAGMSLQGRLLCQQMRWGSPL